MKLQDLASFCESVFPLDSGSEVWTITTGYPPTREKVVVHLTINRERKQETFVEEIQLFLDDLEKGLVLKFS